MGMTKGARRRRIADASRHLTGTRVEQYVIGRGHFRWAPAATIAAAVFAVVFVIGQAVGVTVVPGWILLLFIYTAVRPARGIVVNDRGLVLFKLSMITGRPKRPLAFLPATTPLDSNSRSRAIVQLGPERITFAQREYQRLVLATQPVAPG